MNKCIVFSNCSAFGIGLLIIHINKQVIINKNYILIIILIMITIVM